MNQYLTEQSVNQQKRMVVSNNTNNDDDKKREIERRRILFVTFFPTLLLYKAVCGSVFSNSATRHGHYEHDEKALLTAGGCL